MKFELCFRQVFEKQSDIKFQENPSGGFRVVPYGWTKGQTNMKKLIVTSHNFANAHIN